MSVPQFHFQGVFVPADIIYRILAKEISHRDLLLMILVRGLTEKPGKGCYAKRAYFARVLQVTPARISQVITKLKKLKLLKEYEKSGTRYYEVIWEVNFTNSDNPTELVKLTQGVSKINSPTIDEEEDNENTHIVSPPKRVTVTDLFPEPANSPNGHCTAGTKCAQFLYGLLLKNGKIVPSNYRPKQWTNRFTKAIQEHGLTKVQAALKAYEQYFGEQFMVVAYSANTFCEEIQRVLDCATRIEGKDRKKTKRVYDHCETIDLGNGRIQKKPVYIEVPEDERPVID